MKLSIIVPVLDSHEALRRQLLHMQRFLTYDTELIIVDDGSDPPLENTCDLPVQIYQTGDKRPWTWALARNYGASKATGDYLLMFDLDHIITWDISEFVLNRIESLPQEELPRIHFKRRFGVLDENGTLITDRKILESYGLTYPRSRIESHHNSFVMNKDLFWSLGGYREDLIGRPYPQGEDSDFYNKWKKYADEHGVASLEGPTMYVFPTGRFCGDVDHDEHGLFHDLSRKSSNNYWWNQQRREACQKDSQPNCR